MFKKKIYISLILLLFTSSCGDSWDAFKRGMTGQKQASTDEFLVKKKDPLILPPQYETLPLPNSKETKKENNIQSVLGTSTQSSENSKINSKLENLILKELKNKK